MFNKNFFYISIIFFSFSFLRAEVSVDVHVKNLSKGTESEKMAACNFLGKEKSEKKYISEIQETLKLSDNSKVAIACANALGYIQEKGSSTTALKKPRAPAKKKVVPATGHQTALPDSKAA